MGVRKKSGNRNDGLLVIQWFTLLSITGRFLFVMSQYHVVGNCFDLVPKRKDAHPLSIGQMDTKELHAVLSRV